MSKMLGYQVYYNEYLIGTYTSLSRTIGIVRHELEQIEVSNESIEHFEEECKHYLPLGLSADYEKLLVMPIEITVG